MNEASQFRCPVCLGPLKKGENSFFCDEGHTFDISRKGYVNLLLPRDVGSGNPGDSKEMLQSRRAFLEKGFYESFSNNLNKIIIDDIEKTKRNNTINILDAGCGEGYYSDRLENELSNTFNNIKTDIYGIDVSKTGVHYAAGKNKRIKYAVASTFHAPLTSNSMDYIMCIFSPKDEEEFRRILKHNGLLIIASPGAKHLYSLRTLLYDNPNTIGIRGTAGDGFKLLNKFNVSYKIDLQNNSDIINLLTMTPYIRHVDEEEIEKAKKLDKLTTEVDINMTVYQKI